jgi:hypothetical protein
MAVDDTHLDGETEYNVRKHVRFIIVPLPDKVFMPAEVAEVIAWEAMRDYLTEWPRFKTEFAGQLGSSEALGDGVTKAWSESKILAKTYLTFGWKHKERILKSGASQLLREMSIFQNLPRMVWVTEFARLDDVNTLDIEKRRIFGHCVLDATSTGAMRLPLLFHAPGWVSLFRSNADEFFPEVSHELKHVADDRLYIGRLKPERGS